MVLKSTSAATVKGGMVGDVGSRKMSVDVILESSDAEAALHEAIFAS